jgi:hypothetical protein
MNTLCSQKKHFQRVTMPGRIRQSLLFQSGASGSLLLTAANLAALRYEPTRKSPETQSMASSTHFTVVNVMTRIKTQPLSTCCCQSHQLTTLVFTMSSIFLVAIIMAVIYLESKYNSTHNTVLCRQIAEELTYDCKILYNNQ